MLYRGILSNIFILFFFSSSLWGNSPVVLKNDKKNYKLGLHISIFEDTTSKLTIEDVSKIDNFKKSKKEIINIGFSNSSFWGKLKIKNKSDEKTWFLSFNNYQQNDVRLFQKTKNGWQEKILGDVYSFSKRDVVSKPMVFVIKPQADSTYYLRVKGVISQINLSLSTPIHFVAEQTHEDYILGIFFGLMITMAIYNFLVFISTRSKSNLLYVGYVIFFALAFANLLGYSQRYIFKDFPWMNNQGYLIFVNLTGIFVILFTNSFLELKKNNPKLFKLMNIFIFNNSLLIITTFFFPIKFIVFTTNINLLVYTPFVFICGIIRTKMNYRPSKYFVAGFGVLALTVVVNTLMIFKILPNIYLFRQYGILLGHAFELILISMGLADRFNLIQEEALIKEKKSKEIQKNYADLLRKEVEKRTVELRKKNEKLKSYDYTVAHDLINPIGVALTYVDFYQNVDQDDKKRCDQIVKKIKDALEKTVFIINNILLNFTVDKVDLQKRDLQKIIEMALDHLKIKIEEKNVNMILDIRAKEIICNDVSMYQVFTNLINNSIKFTKEKNMQVKISSFENKGETVVKISDNGIGIDEKKIKTIFNLKSREDIGDLKVKGHGVGLNIVQRLVDENNGKILVESELGKGTTFILVFKGE